MRIQGLEYILPSFILLALLWLSSATVNVRAQTLGDELDPAAAQAVRTRRASSESVSADDPLAALKTGKYIYVRSKSLLVRGAVVEEKLRKQKEFQQLGLVITRNWEEADVVLELRHDLFTMYVYTAIDARTDVVIASGKLSSLGGTVADKVAKRFLKQVMRARGG